MPAKQRRLRSLALSILACAAISWSLAAQEPLTLVSTAWPPLTNVKGQPRFALDLVEAAFDRIGVTSTTTIVAAPQFTSSLLAPTVDGSAAAWKDPERERLMIFSRPYLENRLVLVGRRGTDVSATKLGDLAGRRVAIVEGYAYGDSVQYAGPVFVKSVSEEDSLRRLLDGAVEYTLMDDLVVQFIVNTYPKESASRLQIGSKPLVTRELHLALRRTRSDAESIVARFNAQLGSMIVDGTYHRLLHVEWIRADVNGDGLPEYVPQGERAGATEPTRAYVLFTAPNEELTAPGFYIGGNIYTDWVSVPENYRSISQNKPRDPQESTASLFTFKW